MHSNKIVINGVALFGEEVYGIRRYTQEILREMDSLVKPDEVEIAVGKKDESIIPFRNIKLVPVGVPKYEETKFNLHKIKRLLAQIKYRHYDLKTYLKRKDILSVDAQLVFPLFGCDVIYIYDCIPEQFPQVYPSIKGKLVRLFLLYRQKIAIKKAELIVTCSKFSKKEIQKFYKVPENKIIVVPCGWQHFEYVTEDETVLECLGIEKKSFFFALGSRSYHKNARWILAAAEQNPNEIFVITGSSFGHEDREATNNHLENVIFTGYLNDEQVKALMRHCKAFIQPSLYEGFGIPPLEAMSVGANCIVARAGSLPEVYKNSVWYIDPNDYDHIDLKQIMSKPKENNSIILEEYSWKKSAEQLLAALRTMT